MFDLLPFPHKVLVSNTSEHIAVLTNIFLWDLMPERDANGRGCSICPWSVLPSYSVDMLSLSHGEGTRGVFRGKARYMWLVGLVRQVRKWLHHRLDYNMYVSTTLVFKLHRIRQMLHEWIKDLPLPPPTVPFYSFFFIPQLADFTAMVFKTLFSSWFVLYCKGMSLLPFGDFAGHGMHVCNWKGEGLGFLSRTASGWLVGRPWGVTTGHMEVRPDSSQGE